MRQERVLRRGATERGITPGLSHMRLKEAAAPRQGGIKGESWKPLKLRSGQGVFSSREPLSDSVRKEGVHRASM